MTSRITYSLQRSGNLLFLRASLRGPDSSMTRVRLLIDTGAAYTTLPTSFLEEIGCEVNDVNRRIPIMMASAVGRAPVIQISEFNCLGKSMIDFPVVALNLPFSPLMSGLLGMDFLSQFGATIDIKKAEITMQS